MEPPRGRASRCHSCVLAITVLLTRHMCLLRLPPSTLPSWKGSIIKMAPMPVALMLQCRCPMSCPLKMLWGISQALSWRDSPRGSRPRLPAPASPLLAVGQSLVLQPRLPLRPSTMGDCRASEMNWTQRACPTVPTSAPLLGPAPSASSPRRLAVALLICKAHRLQPSPLQQPTTQAWRAALAAESNLGSPSSLPCLRNITYWPPGPGRGTHHPGVVQALLTMSPLPLGCLMASHLAQVMFSK